MREEGAGTAMVEARNVDKTYAPRECEFKP